MPLPFPGMDPYIEACQLWGDFHRSLISEIHKALAEELPHGYVIRSGERADLTVEEPEEESEQFFEPDVGVLKSSRGKRSRRKNGAAVLQAPKGAGTQMTMRPLARAEYREVFLEIRRTGPERKLVTGIEVLSPSNKRPGSKGWYLYNHKRQAFAEGCANFVEIDLLRLGRRMPMKDEWPESPYYILVLRKEDAPRCRVQPAHYMKPLPPIAIPLADADPDIPLLLQPMIEPIYQRSRYEYDIDYRRPLRPPLPAQESAWLKKRLRELAAQG